jgi:Cu/Ag efflux protein CusF
MEAMTMEFPVRDQAEFAKLAPGKRIRATVHVQELDYWISEIQLQ